VSAGCHITAGPGIGFLDGAGGEDTLLLNEHPAGMVAALFVLPDPRGDEVDGIDDILRPVIADDALRPLGGIAADWQSRVD
jgi:hypothetical protein